jgi:hypothetical protein
VRLTGTPFLDNFLFADDPLRKKIRRPSKAWPDCFGKNGGDDETRLATSAVTEWQFAET